MYKCTIYFFTDPNTLQTSHFIGSQGYGQIVLPFLWVTMGKFPDTTRNLLQLVIHHLKDLTALAEIHTESTIILRFKT